jgi:hypothetical protein
MTKPEKRLRLIKALAILLKASITITKRNGERESPCLTPLELLKKPAGEPLINTKNEVGEIQKAIQEHHFCPNPHLLRTYNRNSQLT